MRSVFLAASTGGIVLALVGLMPRGTPDAVGKWRKDFVQFAHADAVNPPPADGVVFVGSSSIQLWSTLAEDFPGLVTINRGLSGSGLANSIFYVDRIVLPYQPRIVVVYAGENEITSGMTPETVLTGFRALRAAIHAQLPETKIVFLAIKESPARDRFRAQVRTANQIIAADCATDPRQVFVDVASPMLAPDGGYRRELFQDDGLHLSADGYALWTRILAPHLASAPH